MNDEIIPLEDDIYEEEIEVEEETAVMNAMWGNISGNIENQTDLQQALDAKQDNLTQAQLDAVNSGITSAKVATYDGYPAQIASAVSSEADIRRQADTTLQSNIDAEERARKAADKDIQDVLDGETLARQNADTALGGRIDTEIHDRQVADIALQGQIDAITSKSDVVDVVATYADLQAYDTQHLGDNDVIKVLDDETHGDALTYYRWSKTNQTWTFIGQEAPYYSKSQTDTLLLDKQNTIDSSHKLSADLVDDASTTNKFVTAQDKTNWNAKQDALTAGNNIDITGTTISTPAIAPEVVAELPATGTEGKLYLTPKNYTRGTGTGNPITATITDESGKMESFKLDGDTFQQTYTGKNLFNPTATPWVQDIAYNTSGQQHWSGYYGINEYQPVEASTQYAFSNNLNKPIHYGLAYYDSSKNLISTNLSDLTTFTTPASCAFIRFAIQSSTAPTWAQLELGSSATSYEPYVGGVPSPNPDYPQPIQAVTGLQTISINGTDYPLDLGSIELCKLGDYQDYIWKDGEDWKVHKATREESASGLTWEWANIGWYFTRTEYGSGYDINKINIISESFMGVARRTAPTISHAFITMALDGNVGIRNPDITGASNVEAFTEWLDNLNTNYTYALATPTDTVITDQTLIAQLEAIRTASLQNGTNTITNTATGSNLAGDMEIGYYGFAPRNRYDKWLWLDINNEYEQIGS